MPIARQSAFTLIELLIVVAIIAILAAIAVPNFLEAQTRAKVSRVASDMRSLTTAIEAYRIDNNRYPPRPITPSTINTVLPPPNGRPPSSAAEGKPRSYSFITTPIAFMTSIPIDVFERRIEPPWNTIEYFDNYYTEKFFRPEDGRGGFTLYSVGPDTVGGYGNGAVPRGYYDDMQPGTSRVPYDPTNGSLSQGNVFRLSHNSNPPPLFATNPLSSRAAGSHD